MNQSQALSIARNAVSIYTTGGTTGWTVSKPWKSTDPKGPTTQTQVGYYSAAVRRQALAVADIAMCQLLEGEDREVREEAYAAMAFESESGRTTSARDLLRIGLKAAADFKARYTDAE